MSDTPSGYPGAPPGWYPDPAGGPGQRWWDGYAWNEATTLPQHPPPPPTWAKPPGNPLANAGQPPWTIATARLWDHNTAGLVANEKKMVPMARLAMAVPGIYYLVQLITQRLNSARLLSEGHQIRLIWEAAQNGATPPRLTDNASLAPVEILTFLLTVAAVVLACIWQHRAASAARSLHLPATHSPGWGVGSWFVPVVNLWMPYQAIRDCLPPQDAGRPMVLRWWLILMATWSLSLSSGIAAPFSSGLALALSIPAALLCLALIATAPRVVTAIDAAHRVALQGSGRATPVQG